MDCWYDVYLHYRDLRTQPSSGHESQRKKFIQNNHDENRYSNGCHFYLCLLSALHGWAKVNRAEQCRWAESGGVQQALESCFPIRYVVCCCTCILQEVMYILFQRVRYTRKSLQTCYMLVTATHKSVVAPVTTTTTTTTTIIIIIIIIIIMIFTYPGLTDILHKTRCTLLFTMALR